MCVFIIERVMYDLVTVFSVIGVSIIHYLFHAYK